MIPTKWRIRADLRRRRIEDRFAAGRIAGPEVTARSLSALSTFASARRMGIRTRLLLDLPLLRELHTDLDRAAAAHPSAGFLRNFRASDRWIVRQEREFALADTIEVRGAWVACKLRDRGFNPYPAVQSFPTRKPTSEARTLLLAGPAIGRAGLFEAAAAIRELPGMTLLVRPIDVTPPEILDHPRIRAATAAERKHLVGVDRVLAPSWVEAYSPEVATASSKGIAIIGTRRAMGFFDGQEVAPGDVAGLRDTVLRPTHSSDLPCAFAPSFRDSSSARSHSSSSAARSS